MDPHIYEAICDCPEYFLKVGDEFEVVFPENEADLITIRVASGHEFQITQAMLETLGKPFRLG
jgi:hypothetical protein